jgi:peroxiredoxin
MFHNPSELPSNLPVPPDDGAANHLAGLKLPSVALAATDGTNVDLSAINGRMVVYVYPRTGIPGQEPPDGWEAIPGARGCAVQSCGFRDHFSELRQLGVTHLFGLSTQDTRYQQEAADRLHLPFPLLADDRLILAHTIHLPTFEVEGITLLKRLVLVIDEGTITKIFYPVFPPDKSAEEVMAWISSSTI